MHFPGEEFRSSVVLPYEFSAVRVFGDTLHPSHFKVKVQCTPTDADKRTPTLVEERSHEAMQRLNFWWETILTDCVIIDVNSEMFEPIIGSVGNSAMFCPAPPTDHLLVELLHSKMSAITKGMFDIHAITLVSSDTQYVETSFRNVDGYMLPGIEYFGGDEALHKEPWWQRDTIEVCEFAKGSVIEEDLYNHFSDFFGKKEADIIIFKAEDDEDGQV